MGKARKVYPSDVTEEEWWFVLPYLLLCREDAGQREHDLRDVFDAVRYVARSGCAWRMIPGDLPPWAVVKHPMAKRGFVLLSRRWVVERSFAWAVRFRRLAQDYERLPQTLKGIHFIAFAILMTSRLITLPTS